MALDPPTAARSDYVDVVVKSCCDRGRAERACSSRGELDRQRDSVEATADVLDDVPRLGDEAGVNRGRPGHEELEGIGGDVEGGHADHDLPVDAERLTASRDDRQAAAMPQDVRDEGGNGVEHVLAVVEDQQDLALADPLDERGASRGAGTGDEADGRGDDGLDLVSRVRRRELDEPRAIGHFLAQRSRRGEREASLADAARTGQRDEA